MNTIVVDIGNSGTRASLLSEGFVLARTSLPRDSYPADGVPEWLDFFSFAGSLDEVGSIGFAAVVPGIRSSLLSFLSGWSGDVIEVSASIDLPFRIDYETPLTLGADRLAAAAGAWNLFGSVNRHVVVVDAGTAVNYEIVTADAVYRGGPIAPGLRAMRDALIADTAQLPTIPLTLLDRNIGSSTVTAVQAGVVYGFVDSVKGMITRISNMLESNYGQVADEMFVVLAGGDAPLLIDAGVKANRFEPEIVQTGIADILFANVTTISRRST